MNLEHSNNQAGGTLEKVDVARDAFYETQKEVLGLTHIPSGTDLPVRIRAREIKRLRKCLSDLPEAHRLAFSWEDPEIGPSEQLKFLKKISTAVHSLEILLKEAPLSIIRRMEGIRSPAQFVHEGHKESHHHWDSTLINLIPHLEWLKQRAEYNLECWPKGQGKIKSSLSADDRLIRDAVELSIACGNTKIYGLELAREAYCVSTGTVPPLEWGQYFLKRMSLKEEPGKPGESDESTKKSKERPSPLHRVTREKGA